MWYIIRRKIHDSKETDMGTENWRMWHVGLSVKSIDEAVKYFESMGGKAAERGPNVLDSARFENLRTYDRMDAPPWKIKINH